MKQQSLRARLLLFIVVVMLTPVLPGSYLYYRYTTTLNDTEIVHQQSDLKFSMTQDVIHSFHRQSIAWASFLLRGHKPELYNSHLREFYSEERQTTSQTELLADLLTQDPEYSVDISHIQTEMKELRKHYRNALEIYNLSEDPYFDTDQFISPFINTINHGLQQYIHQIETQEKTKLSTLDDDIVYQKKLFLTLIIIILFVAIFVFIWFFDINVGRPITVAINTAKRIADGDIKSRIEEESTREFSVFSIAFNHMIDNLEQANQQLEGKINQLQDEVNLRKIAERKIHAQKQVLESSKIIIELARQEAVTTNQAKNEFLSTMSHELRTPLNAILGFGQLLDMKYTETTDIEAQEHIGYIMQAGHHLLELINEVLDLSRIESGYLNLSLEPVALHQAITSCISQIDVGMAKKYNITLINQIDDQGFEIMADPVRFNQVIINLLSNAVKYNTEGGTVTIKTEPVDNGRLNITITDTGHGIAAADMDKLFDPFERLSAKHGRIEGTGIGLTITKRLVEEMGGVLGVESTVGQGTTFMVGFPLNTGMSRSVVSDKISLPEIGAIANKIHKVLYIEDNSANAQLVLDALNRRGGFEVLTSPTAELGLTIAEENIPDIILMDINLPGIDGIAALNILRSVETTKHIPVIAVTASAMDNDIQAGRDAGFDDYLTKPIDIDQLFAVIERQISKSITT